MRDTKTNDRKSNSCLCGCKTRVRGHFAQGHDQRFRGFVLRVTAGTATAKEQAAVGNYIANSRMKTKDL